MQKPKLLNSGGEACTILGKYISEGLFVDVLWDRAAHPELLHDFFSQNREQYAALFQETPFEHLAAMSPFLWRSNGEPDDFLRRLIEEETPLVTVFVSGAPFSLQKAHLQSLLEAYLPDGNCTHLRLYNELVFQRLLGSCTSEEAAHLLGPNTAAMYPDEPGREQDEGRKWLLAENPAASSPAHPAHLADTYALREAPWWHLRDEHFAAFEDSMLLVLADNIAQELWYRDTPHAAHINRKYGIIEEFAKGCVTQARKFGLETYEDLLTYACLMAEYEAVPGREELAAAIMKSETAPEARLAGLRAALHGRAAS